MKPREIMTTAYISIIDNIPYAAALLDREFNCIHYNKKVERMIDTPLKRIVGKKTTEILPKSLCQKLVPLMELVLKTNAPVTQRAELNLRGEDVILGIHYAPLLNNDGEVEFIIATTEDWTDFENQPSEIITNSRLEELGHMAANITHEINNPLQLIQLRLFKLEEMINKTPSQTSDMLTEIRNIFKTIDRVTKIVESVRRQSKEIEPKRLGRNSLKHIISETLTHTQEIVADSKSNFFVDLPRDLDVLCNPLEIEQVLINLINNSCDAIKNEQDRWIRLSSYLNDDDVIIQIQDSGTGISEKNQSHIMKPFFTTKKFPEGTGLGLGLSKTLAKRNNGDLNYISQMKNTTFEVKLKKA